jgi:glycosyltransferase involved in cell wall biosynthesis
MVEGYGLGKHVEFKFDVSESEKKDLLKRSRVLILPSPVEGFGIVVLEANALGLPVVASDGVPESVVRHGENGLRYSFGDVDALAHRIVQILQDESIYDKLSDGSRSFVQQFAWSKVGAQFEGVVKRIVPQRKLVNDRIAAGESRHN